MPDLDPNPPHSAGPRRLGAAPAADQLDPAELISADELAATQLTRLQQTLRRAYDRVPFYRQAFDAAGLRPEDCETLADLARFPLTGKGDLRENYPFGMFAVPREEVRRIHASSGTTGRTQRIPGATLHRRSASRRLDSAGPCGSGDDAGPDPPDSAARRIRRRDPAE